MQNYNIILISANNYVFIVLLYVKKSHNMAKS